MQTEDLTEEDSVGREECCFQLAPLRALTVTRASRQVVSLGNERRDLQLVQGREQGGSESNAEMRYGGPLLRVLSLQRLMECN